MFVHLSMCICVYVVACLVCLPSPAADVFAPCRCFKIIFFHLLLVLIPPVDVKFRKI